MRAPHDAGLAAPCRDCGSTGGHYHKGCHRPSRARGLCQGCESKHAKRGTLDQYPLMTGNHLQHPVITRDYVDPFMLGCRRDAHAVGPHCDAAAVLDEARCYAERWLGDAGRRARAMAWVWAQPDATAAHLLFANTAGTA